MAVLRHGERGPGVRRLQERLAAAGFLDGVVDGIFGDATESAVEQFQRSQGLAVDGVAGPRTLAALASLPNDGPGGTVEDEGGEPDAESDLDDPGGDAPGTPVSFPDHFDNWDGELARRYRPEFFEHSQSGRMLAWKGRPQPVDMSRRTHVCCHITAVTYGTTAAARAAWRERISSGEISAPTLRDYGGTADPAAAATRMALHERFWKVAYHWVGLLNGDVLYNNAASRYTYHGNAANRFSLGVSAEAVLPGRESRRNSSHTTVDDAFIETNRITLRKAVTSAREEGAPLDRATAHRCFSSDREGDPGEAYWREVLLPVCRELDVEVDYHLVDGGRPVPTDWDPRSPFDWTGRRIG